MRVRLLGLAAISVLPAWAAETLQRLELPAVKTTILTIRNDGGRITLRGSGQAVVRATFRHTPPAGRSNEDLIPVARQDGTSILLEPSIAAEPRWPVHLEVEAPAVASIHVQGSNTEVVVENVRCPLTVQTATGNVRSENISGPASLATGSGNIEFIELTQTLEDIQLNTGAGAVRCQLDGGLKLRAVLRSSSSIAWGSEVETARGHLERELGGGGPMLYAVSRDGAVSVSVVPTSVESQNRVTEPMPAPAGATIRVDVSWVYMNVSVKDPLRNTSITGLRKQDFAVYENDVPTTVEHFESAEAPFHLLLLLDSSESIRPRIGLIRAAAIEFARRVRPEDRLAVASFNSTVRLRQNFTANREQAIAAINGVVPGGTTAAYDAVATAVGEYVRGISGRKAIVLFSDGVDNSLDPGNPYGSRRSFDDVLQQVRESECLIYPIFLKPELPRSSGVSSGARTDPFSDVDRMARIANSRTDPLVRSAQELMIKAESHLRAFAEQSGGRVYMPNRVEDLAPAYADVAGDLKVQYTLGFKAKPGGRAGEWRPLKIRVRDHPLAVIRTRAGYYAPSGPR